VFDASKAPGDVVAALRALLAHRPHALPFEEARGGGGGAGGGDACTALTGQSSADTACMDADGASGGAAAAGNAAAVQAPAFGPLLEASRANVAALHARLRGWGQMVKTHQTPSRVVKWAL